MTYPSIFVGHGNPMHAIGENAYTRAWSSLGERIGTPRAILSISAHWYVGETGVTIATAPRTIHDFGGFPPALYEVQYPAPGDPELARRVQALLAPLPVTLDDRWGLDHGTWSVLRHAYPKADVPVVQLSIDGRQPGTYHYEIGRRLAPLRAEGVLIAGSGNLVHNLRRMRWNEPDAEPYDWAVRFDETARDLIAASDYAQLVDVDRLGPDARLAAPTPEHFLPLLYVLGSAQTGERATFPVEGIDAGSISMRAVQIG